MKKIGILNAGGDCAGLNAVIASAVKAGTAYGYEFIGFEKGWEGVLDPMLYIPLDIKSVRGIGHLGGTILKTVNKGRFAGKAGSGSHNAIPEEILNQAKANLAKLGVDALIVIGGDGTLSGAMQLADRGVNIVGVPKTIDNDLGATDITFGFSTAVDVAVEAIDRVHTTATSHDRVLIVETMGRNAGWIALHAGLAGGVHAILIPEVPFKYNNIVNFLKHRKEIGKTSSIIVIAEGARPLDGDVSGIVKAGRPELLLGGISDQLGAKIEELAGDEFEVRNVVLGHTQRGGAPNAEDRILAQRYGVAAIDAIQAGKFGEMVCLKNSVMTTAPIREAVQEIKHVTEDAYAFQTARRIGIYLGD